MPNYDVIVYHDLSSVVASVRPGDSARELGDIFGEDMFVSGVYRRCMKARMRRS